MERTRFKCNGKPVFETKIGTLIYTDKHGAKCEQSGMTPIVELAEKEDVLDEAGWNIRYIKPGSVAHAAYIAAMKRWLLTDSGGLFQPTEDNLELAKKIALEGFRRRATERGEVVADMSGGCKFASLFFKTLFGGELAGHYDHQYNILHGQIFDLNAGCADVAAMRAAGEVYRHDPSFFGCQDHLDSMMSCLGRVNEWAACFADQVELLPAPRM